MDRDKVEETIIEKRLTAPRITPEAIEAVIVNSTFHIFPGSQLTVCCITLKNGFTVTGESACASPENFNQQLGEAIAYRNAKDKIWVLEGYLLKQNLYNIDL